MGGAPAAAAPAAGGRPGSGGRRLSRMEASARADEEERRMNTGERRGREVTGVDRIDFNGYDRVRVEGEIHVLRKEKTLVKIAKSRKSLEILRFERIRMPDVIF